MVLLDTNREQWDAAPGELGAGVTVGQLITPLTGFSDYGAAAWAGDNGAFSGLDVKRYRAILARQFDRMGSCLFQAVPDAPFSARRTRELFERWKTELRGWPRAYVTQNGQEQVDIPWSEIKALFIGGDDEHKDGPEGIACARAAIGFEKHLRFGRVNGPKRMRKIIELFGGYERLSIDGSGISKHSHMRVALGRAIRGEDEQAHLFGEERAA